MAEVRKREPVKVELDYPVEYDGQVYDSITLQRPKGKHLKKLSKDVALQDILRIAVSCSGISNNVFDELDASDTMKIAEAMTDFLDSGRGTSES